MAAASRLTSKLSSFLIEQPCAADFIFIQHALPFATAKTTVDKLGSQGMLKKSYIYYLAFMMRSASLFILSSLFFTTHISAQQPSIPKLLYGVAYYDEYMPYERLDKDIQMMKEAGINVVRIAESTWSTVEPQDGLYDFSHIDKVLNAMHKAGISVIVGTPTYAFPTWLARKHPDVLAITPQGQNRYGARQNMDISNKNFRFYAERVIRKIMEHIKHHPAIIGYQVDNETKAYNTAGPDDNLYRLYNKRFYYKKNS